MKRGKFSRLAMIDFFGLAFLAVVISATYYQDTKVSQTLSDETAYHLNFSASSNTLPSGSGSSVVITELNNPISVAYQNLENSSSAALSMGASSRFYNTTAISGLKEIDVKFSPGSSTKSINISYGWSIDEYFFDQTVSTTDATKIVSCNFNHDFPSFFNVSSAEGLVTIEAISLSYSCVASDNPYVGMSDGLSFLENDENNYYVSGYSGRDTTIVVPSRYKGVKVTSFGSDRQYYSSVIFGPSSSVIPTALILPSTVTSIGTSAFEGCTSLKSIDLSKTSIITIGEKAFNGCSSLSSIILPSSLRSLGPSCFYGTAFPYFFVPDGVISIGGSAFAGSTALSMMYIPLSVASIGEYLVDMNTKAYFPIYCAAITRPNWPTYLLSSYDTCHPLIFDSTMHYDRTSRFFYTTPTSDPTHSARIVGYDGNSTELSLPSLFGDIPVTSIGLGYWANKSVITDLSFPTSLETIMDGSYDRIFSRINNGVFFNFIALKSVVLPTGTISVGSYAFYGDTALIYFRIPESVITLGKYVIFNASGCAVECGALSAPSGWNASWYSSVKSILWGLKGNFEDNLFKYRIYSDGKGGGYASIVATKTLSGFVQLPEMVDGYPLTRIEKGAIRLYGLQGFYIPKTISTIEYDGISSSSPIYLEAISASTGFVSGWASGYASLIHWGIALKESSDFKYYVDDSGFAEIIAYTGSSTEISIPVLLGNVTVTTIKRAAFTGCSSLANITVPSSITSIESRAFADSGLTHFDWPATVPSIPDYAFENSLFLASVSLPSSLSSVGIGAFSGCVRLSSLPSLPASIQRIPSNCFAYCGLENLNIPESIFGLDDGAFHNCGKLVTLTLPSTMTSTGNSTFSGCTKLTTVSMPGTLQKIGNNAFSGCTSLSSVVIPDSVEILGNLAFSSCTSLSSIHLPSSLQGLDNEFTGCTSLLTIEIPSSVSTISSELGIGNSIVSYTINSANTNFLVSDDGRTIVSASTHEIACVSIANTTQIVIPSIVTKLTNNLFASYLGKIGKFYIPSSVTTITGSPFYQEGNKDDTWDVFCQATSKPTGWDEDWDVIYKYSEDGDDCWNVMTVSWGQTW